MTEIPISLDFWGSDKGFHVQAQRWNDFKKSVYTKHRIWTLQLHLFKNLDRE